MHVCKQCGRTLLPDEIAVHRKLVARDATEFFCKACLAQYFDVDVAKIDQKIAQFKRQGCQLFVYAQNQKQED